MDFNKILTIFLILVITVLGIHLFNNSTRGIRLDLTEQRVYSLTDGTKEILEKMKGEGVKPIELKLYFSYTAGKTLPQFIKNFINYRDYVHNLLKEYERASDGKIKVTLIDPKPDSDEADDAAAYRLDGKPINNQGDLFFFGLAFVTQTGSKDAIEFLWPEQQESLEYEISKRIYGLIWPQKKRIAVLSGIEPLPDTNPYMMQMLQAQGKQPPEPWTSMKVLEESYTVSRLDPDTEQISKDDYDLLMVIHPKGFGDKTLWAINEWVVTGGNTIVFLDPYSIEDQPVTNPQQPWAQLQYQRSSELKRLLDVWGVTMADDTFAADYQLAVKRRADRTSPPAKMMTDLMITDKTAADTLNSDSPIFNGLNQIYFFGAGVLEKKADAKAEITPLITTTSEGGTLVIKPGFGGEKGSLAYTDMGNPAKLLDSYQPEKKLTLAYLISGKLDSAFPEGATFPKETPKPPPGMPPGFQMPPPEDAEMITKEALPEDSIVETRVLVFSDVDFITDQLAFQQSLFGVQPVNDNYKVLLNSADFLLGARELMNVRSKKSIRRPFEHFDAIEAAADRKMLDKEQSIRAEIEQFQETLRDKQSSMNQKNAVLMQKQVQEEISGLNAKIADRNKELREIKKEKRKELESAEAWVRFWVMWFMPIVVCIAGIVVYIKRKSTTTKANKG